MAQIRKLQPGGKTPNKIGVLTIDGKEYTGDGFIQHMRDYRKTLDDKVADQFGNIINALEAGENLQYDSDSDVLTGNVNWNVSKLQEKRLDKGEDRTKLGKVFGGLNEGKEQRVRYAINALRGMSAYEEPHSEPIKEEINPKSFDWSDSIELDYTMNNDGTKSVSKMGNVHVVDRLNQLQYILSDKWSENDAFTGWNNYTRDHYKNVYLEQSTLIPEIIERIETGAWTDDDLLILTDLGIIDDKQPTQISKEKKVVDTSTKKSNVVGSVDIANNDDNTKKVSNNDTKEHAPSVTDEIIQAYEESRKINKKILEDNTSREERRNIISPTNHRNRSTKLKFSTKTNKPDLTAVRQRNIDALLARLDKNKERDTIIKYEIPLWYKRDTSNITYIKHGGIIKGEDGLSFDPRTGVWGSNGTPIVFSKENGIEPNINLFPQSQLSIERPMFKRNFRQVNFVTDNLDDVVETFLYDKANPMPTSSEQYLTNLAKFSIYNREVPNFEYTPSTLQNPTKFNLLTSIDNPFAITKGFLAGSLGEKYSIENFKNRTLTQNSNESNGNQTSERNAGEAPPKWKQNLKDYASRAFNYENLNTLGQIVGAVAANHKVAKVKENALKSMPLSRNVFQASIPAYYEDTRGFDVRRDALLNTQLPKTADAKLNAQWKLNILSELDKVNREKYDYLSQNRNQYNQFVNQIENKNRELRVAESNAFMDRLSQRNMALAENTAGMIANDFKTFEQALKKGLYNYQQDRAVYDQLSLSDRKKMLFDKYSKAAADWAKTNKAVTGEEYMSDIDRYFKYNQAAKDLYENDIMQLNKSIYRPHSLFSPRFVKKSGKLSAQDHIKINKHKSQDRILENKYKAIDKAVQKLNDNVIKIFLNTMK